jgi:hypothetical protein
VLASFFCHCYSNSDQTVNDFPHEKIMLHFFFNPLCRTFFKLEKVFKQTILSFERQGRKLVGISFCHLSPNFNTFKDPRNRFQGINSASLCSLAGRYDHPIYPSYSVPSPDGMIKNSIFVLLYWINKLFLIQHHLPCELLHTYTPCKNT